MEQAYHNNLEDDYNTFCALIAGCTDDSRKLQVLIEMYKHLYRSHISFYTVVERQNNSIEKLSNDIKRLCSLISNKDKKENIRWCDNKRQFILNWLSKNWLGLLLTLFVMKSLGLDLQALVSLIFN